MKFTQVIVSASVLRLKSAYLPFMPERFQVPNMSDQVNGYFWITASIRVRLGIVVWERNYKIWLKKVWTAGEGGHREHGEWP